MHLSQISLALTRLSGQFSPASLFAAGEVGAWYDPSDLSTLFDDSAGTTPVSAPGNGADVWVGLMLDKSKGLVLGSELVTNGDFSNGSIGWTVISGAWTVANGRLNAGNTDGIKRYAQSASNIVAGRWYKATWNQYAGAGTGAANWTVPGVWNGSDNLLNGGNYINGAGEKTIYFVAPVSGQFYIYNFEQEVEYDNFTVRELPGNHATQTTSAKRPKLAARYNLLTYTEQFDNAAWTKQNVTVTQNAVIAPNGTLTADELINTAVTNNHFTEQLTITPVAGAAYRLTWRVKKNTVRYVVIGWNRTPTDNAGAGFDLDVSPPAVTGVGQIGSGYAASNAAATLLNDGWVELAVTLTGPASPQYATLVHRSTAYTSGAIYESYAGTTADKTYIWGADLRPASQATGLIGPTYQRVVDAATYDTAGFLPYLEFDGIDDSMSTGSIDFTATDKMTVWAGVRKLSDAAAGIFAELSTNAGTNAGAFYISAPETGANYGIRVGGFFGYNHATFAAPITNVISGNWNLASGPISSGIVDRFNGVINTTGVVGVTMPGGTFGNYPLFIGQRGGSSVPFNGWLTSLIVRGAQSTQSQIEATESWVNSRTGAY
jgi:hypothetical protein